MMIHYCSSSMLLLKKEKNERDSKIKTKRDLVLIKNGSESFVAFVKRRMPLGEMSQEFPVT